METLYIVMPAYNEEDSISPVVRNWQKIASDFSPSSRLLVIDDGSKDHTGDILKTLADKYQAVEVVTKKNSGHGPTVIEGYKIALERGADYIFQTDSDGQTVADEILPFLEERHEHAAVMGQRRKRQDGIVRFFVTRALRLTIWLIYGAKVWDANVPFRLMSREILEKYLPTIPDGAEVPNAMLSAAFVFGKEDIRYMPVSFLQRKTGKSTVRISRLAHIAARCFHDFRAHAEILKKRGHENGNDPQRTDPTDNKEARA